MKRMLALALAAATAMCSALSSIGPAATYRDHAPMLESVRRHVGLVPSRVVATPPAGAIP